MKRAIYKFILRHIFGWSIEGDDLLSIISIKKSVIISAPHTHWLDFYLGILIRGALGFKSNYLAKKELFVFPYNIFLKWTGGIPVNRSSNNDLVKQIAEIFKKKKEFRISLAPEGTRKRVEKFKSGFYYIAKEAEVPVIMFTMDYSNKKTLISKPFYPTDNKKSDFEYIESYFDGVLGKVAEYSFFKKN